MLTLEQVKSKSAKQLVGLHPVVLKATEALIDYCYSKGINIVVSQGLRTIAYQNSLYAQGRTQAQLNSAGLSHVIAKPTMTKVTDARGGYSYHNFGLAIDFCLLLPDGKNVTWDMSKDYNSNNVRDWIEVVDGAKALGFSWGGDWITFKDYPHFDITFGMTTFKLRGGEKPPETKVKAAHGVIDNFLANQKKQKEEEPMTAEEKKQFDEMSTMVKEQAKTISALQEQVTKLSNLSKMDDIPSWALTPCVNAKSAGLLDTTANGSYDFYRMVTILDRAGMFKQR